MIVCCGEALIDMVPRALPTGENVFLPVPGGAVFNTAITLGRLGAPAGFLSGLSTDMFGAQLMEALAASSVDASLCIRSDRPSTLAFVKLTDGHAEYTFMDENSAGRMITADDLPALPPSVEALHFGAISLIPEPCGSAYESLALAMAESAVISLDPNIRPSFIKDEDAHRARIRRMIAVADIVKVSDEDLAWIDPDNSAENAIAAMLEGQGPSLVILTKGADGVTLCSNSGTRDIAARKVNVIDTIGAGDSFNGGFLEGLRRAGLLTKAALRDAEIAAFAPAAELATRVAAVTVSRAGANPPWGRELEE